MTAFVLGNGISRQVVDVDLLGQRGKVYGCNALYRTHRPWVLVATDRAIAAAIQQSGYARENRFYTRYPLLDSGAIKIDAAYFGFSSGPVAVSIAAQDGHPRIYLLGFDMNSHGGRFNNIYAGTDFYKPAVAEPTYTGNWQRQLRQVFQEFGDLEFVRVCGETTAEIPKFQQIPNLRSLAISEFLQRLNTSEDL